ncbi:MAG: L,D-transpeptidase [Alphaproteobacteria bacterium]|nr:L,D-transpeptidase [Alphaproteobacteria bacterium]
MSVFRTLRRAALIVAATAAGGGSALAQPLAMTEPVFPQSLFDRVMVEPRAPQSDFDRSIEREPQAGTPAHLHRQTVAYPSQHAPGTVVIDTANTYLYFVLDGARAIRYGIGVGREGFTWSGTQAISRKQEWPDWHPPAEMIARQPYLPRYMAGGPGNPLGARALYLGSTLYRIHGTSEPDSIGRRVSSGCIRMLNEDVTDLYNRVGIGTRVVVLQDARRAPSNVARAPVRERASDAARQSYAYEPPRPVASAPHHGSASLQYGSSASRLY